MGKVTGFMEYERLEEGYAPVAERVKHHKEFVIALQEDDARVQGARMADALGEHARGDQLRRQAEDLREAFEDQFWCDAESTYAIALDRHKQPCRVRSSNAGHCLFGGIASPDRARRVAQTLLGAEMFSGWGVRTVSSVESRYNPMSYHNGSVWPHDNGLMAAGLSRYRFDDLIGLPFAGLFDASVSMDGHRLPELFCGFHRREGEGPTLYPVACSPQAWAAGASFLFVETMLGLKAHAAAGELELRHPTLPDWIGKVTLTNLRVGEASVDLLFHRWRGTTSAEVLRKVGDLSVTIRL